MTTEELESLAAICGPSLKTTSKNVEHLEIVCDKPDESKPLFDWLWSHGFRTKRVGPYTDGRMHPQLDMARILFTAEREIETE